jgi:hypothetical protein
VTGTDVNDPSSALWFDLSGFGTDSYLIASIFQNDKFIAARRSGEKLVLFLDGDEALARAAILGAATSEEIYSQFRQLTVQRLGYVYRRLEEWFPAASDPKLDGIVTSRHTVSRIREGALNVLRQIGTFEAVREIEQLSAANPASLDLKYVLAAATQFARAATWETPSTEAFVELFVDSDRRLVRDSHELASIVLESLIRLQGRVKGPNSPAAQYWDESRDAQKPKSETRLADNLREYLDLVLRQQAIIINREVEIRNLSGRGIGERTDLLISAASKSPESSKLDVAYGIYLVGWFLCPLWSQDDPRYRQAAKPFGQMSLSDVRTQFEVQAAALSGDVEISSCVLDLSLG